MRLVLSLAAALLPVSLSAADPDPKALAVPADRTAKAKAAVVRLDDDDIDVRDAASKELADMKRFALPALQAALKANPSNEVQIRVERLLPAARKDDFTARCEAFVADTGRKYDHDLPGWNELKQAAGDTPEARKLFAAVLKTEERRAVLLGAFDPAPVKTTVGRGREVEGHWAQLQWARHLELLRGRTAVIEYPDRLEYLAGGLIADLMRERDQWVQMMPSMVHMLLRGEDKEAVLAGTGEYKDALTKLAVRWVETRTHPRSLRDAIQLCVDMKLGESLQRKCLEKSCELAIQGGPLMSNVLSDLAKTGDAKYVATIRQFLQDERDLLAGALSGTFSYQIQQRDVALAMCLLLTKQEPKEYGFDVGSDKADLRYWESNYRFLPEKGKTAGEKREAAFKKWAEWEKANPDALKAAPPKEKK